MKSKTLNTAFCFISFSAVCAFQLFAESIGPGFTYQGRLLDGGVPANGRYDMIFNLYDAPTNGSALGSFSIFGAVPVTNGLFTVELNAYGEFGANALNGQARWLDIGVRTNKNNALNPWVSLAPRQPLTPAPTATFALNAGLASNVAPGAVSWFNITGIPAGFADEVDNDTLYAAGPGVILSGPNNQFSVNFAGSGGADTAARSDHEHFGHYWNGSSLGFGLSVVNSSVSGSAFYAQQGAGSGRGMLPGLRAAIWGESSTGDAVYGASGGTGGMGVYGYAGPNGGANAGVVGQTDSGSGVGVLAQGSGSAGTALKIASGVIRVAGAGINTATPAFMHQATAANSFTGFSTNYVGTIINNPACNDDPNAIILTTPNWSSAPSAGSAVVKFENSIFATNRWVIYVPGDSIRLGNRWNVMVIKP